MNAGLLLLLIAVGSVGVVVVGSNLSPNFKLGFPDQIEEELPPEVIPALKDKPVNFFEGTGGDWNRLGGGSGGGGSPPPPPPITLNEAVNAGTLGASGNGRYFEGHPAEVQVPFVQVAGKIGQGVYQNGTATGGVKGEIEFGTSVSTWGFLHKANVGNNITSINFWMNGDVDGASSYPILTTGDSDNGNAGLSIFTQPFSGTHFRVEDGSGLFIDQSAIAQIPDDSNWHMITYVYDKGNTTSNFGFMCLDSICTDTGNPSNVFTTGTNDAFNILTLGGGTGHANAPIENEFDVDEIIIWNGYQLTQSDINSMWNTGTGATGGGISSGSQVLRVTFDSFI